MGYRSTLAVFEPLLCGLVAADVKIPRRFRDIAEILLGVDIYVTVLV